MSEQIIVRGDGIYFDPSQNQQDPHQYYRDQIGKYNIAVTLTSESEYKSDKQRIIELETKLSVAIKALKIYANHKDWAAGDDDIPERLDWLQIGNNGWEFAETAIVSIQEG